MNATERTLEQQRAEFADRKFLAMPIAGTIAWAVIGIVGATMSITYQVWAVFIGTGMIFYLGLLVAKFTGEDLLGKTQPKNVFDRLFMIGVFGAMLVYALAIPFFLVEPTSLPLTVGVLAGLMWMPFSWIIQHWVGIFHAVSRTLLCVLVYYVFPDDRFVAIPLVIVGVYAVTIAVLLTRHRTTRMQPVAY
jgi:hypothetical protein